jgi:hypothetical protein
MWFLLRILLLPWALEAATAPKLNNCGPGQHWVIAHHRRAYSRADGTTVRAADVKAHCQKNPSGYEFWNQKLTDGRPPFWPYQKEQPASWTSEERERALEALGELPDFIKNKHIGGIYRLKNASFPGNPATNNFADIAVYDEAFDPPYVLSEVLGHEFSHRLFEELPEEQKKSFRTAGDWLDGAPGQFRAGRPENQFLRKNGRLSVVEDFADDIPAFVLTPTKLKKTAPKVYNWIDKNFGKQLKPGGQK